MSEERSTRQPLLGQALQQPVICCVCCCCCFVIESKDEVHDQTLAMTPILVPPAMPPLVMLIHLLLAVISSMASPSRSFFPSPSFDHLAGARGSSDHQSFDDDSSIVAAAYPSLITPQQMAMDDNEASLRSE